MFKSKPIGWITAGTLLCVAGVALACRLRDDGTAPPEAAAAPCSETTDTKPCPGKQATTAGPAKGEVKKRPESGPFPALSPQEKKAPEKPKGTEDRADQATAVPAPPSAAPAPLAVAEPSPPPPPRETERKPAVAESVSPVLSAPPVPETLPPPTPAPEPLPPGREPQTSLGKPLPPEPETTVRPVSATEVEGTSTVSPASAPPAPTAPDKGMAEPDRKTEKPVMPAPPAPATPPVPAPAAPETPSSPPPPPMIPPMRSETPAPAPTAPVPASPTPSDVPMPAPAAPPTPPEAPSALPTPPGTPTYQVPGTGETLRSIAQRVLGSGERWPEIYRLNPDLRPELTVPAGKVVRLPADAVVKSSQPGQAAGGQEKSEAVEEEKRPGVTGVRPLPVVRSRSSHGRSKLSLPLTGTFVCRLDDKHSFVLPRDVRKQLGRVATVLLTPGPDRCLWLGTRASAARVLERVERSSLADREVQTFRRLYFAQTEKSAVDSSGRLIIPARLAEYAGLGKEVVLIGIDDHFELWDAARWQRYSRHKGSGSKR